MSRRISAFIRKKREPDHAPNPSIKEFVTANSNTAPYSNDQAPYRENVAAYPPKVEPPYRAMPPVPPPGPPRDLHLGYQPNPREPRTNMLNPLPYPETPRPLHTIPQHGVNTNVAHSRDRTPSNPSPYSSEFSLVPSPQDRSPRQQNISPTDSGYHLSPGPGPIHGRANELPGGMPYNARAQAGFQDRHPSQDHQHGPRSYQDHQHPSRAPPPTPAAAAAAAAAAKQQYPIIEEVPSPPQGQHAIPQDRLAIQKKRNSSKGTIRQLRHLIREKYRLDVWIWSNRDVLPALREEVKADCDKADVAMQEIYQIIHHWEEDLFEPEEWRVAKKIKEGILKHAEQHKSWEEVLPWDRPDEVIQEAAVGDGTAAVNNMQQ